MEIQKRWVEKKKESTNTHVVVVIPTFVWGRGFRGLIEGVADAAANILDLVPGFPPGWKREEFQDGQKMKEEGKEEEEEEEADESWRRKKTDGCRSRPTIWHFLEPQDQEIGEFYFVPERCRVGRVGTKDSRT